jgi:hypothetical protein
VSQTQIASREVGIFESGVFFNGCWPYFVCLGRSPLGLYCEPAEDRVRSLELRRLICIQTTR